MGSDFSERDDMQNQPNTLMGKQLGRFRLPVGSVAEPRTMLMVLGLTGLFVDLFVRPISPIGLALILLAAAPWLLQAWSQRLQPVAAAVAEPGAQTESGTQDSPRRPPLEKRTGTHGEKAGASKPAEPSLSRRDNPRKIQPLEPAAHGLPSTNSTPEHRPTTAGGSQIRPHSLRTA